VSGGHGALVWGQSRGPQTFWDSLVKWKIKVLVSPIYFQHFAEKPLLLAVFIIFGSAIVLRILVVNRQMLIPLAAFGVIFVAMPSELWGASYADYRLPSGAAFIALASFGWGETSRLRIGIASLLLLLSLIIRVGSVMWAWRAAQPILAEYDTALDPVPPGARLFGVRDGSAWGGYPPLAFVSVLAAAERGVFEPYTFSDQGWQLLKQRTPVASHMTDFDYLLEIGHPEFKIPVGLSLTEIRRGQTYILYKIDKDSVR
jgi:hypothetical protein